MIREIDGFIVQATTVRTNEDFFEPALRVTRSGTSFDETQWATTQDVEMQSEAEALGGAMRWLNEIRSVSYHGELMII